MLVTYAAARRLARYLRALGYRVRLEKQKLRSDKAFYTLHRA